MRVSKPANIQYAALPWRQTNGALEVLLITTLRTGRWIVPKGWPLADVAPCDCAAREALEEAGLTGEIASEPFGAFRYAKQKKSGDSVTCRVEVFTMEVAHQRRSWAEKDRRHLAWCPVSEAMKRVGDPGLRRLIAKFARARATAEPRKPVAARASSAV